MTAILAEWQRGDEGALDRLVPIVYEELRRVARARLRGERTGHTIQTTDLVHETYLRLVDLNRLTVRDRAHLLALAARLMRQVLVDHARKKRAAKRGRGLTLLSLESIAVSAYTPVAEILAVDEALTELSAVDPRLCRVVELKCFAGMSIDEMAEAIGISPATVERDWALAKAWLYQRLKPSVGDGSPSG